MNAFWPHTPYWVSQSCPLQHGQSTRGLTKAGVLSPGNCWLPVASRLEVRPVRSHAGILRSLTFCGSSVGNWKSQTFNLYRYPKLGSTSEAVFWPTEARIWWSLSGGSCWPGVSMKSSVCGSMLSGRCGQSGATAEWDHNDDGTT